jgi:hypothetical protein
MNAWNVFGLGLLLSLWSPACGRVEDSAADAGNSGQAVGGSDAGRAGDGSVSGIILNTPGNGGQTGVYPSPFDARTCPNPVDLGGNVRCVTRAELADRTFLYVTLDGGVAALGPADAWRCPQLNEIAFSGACYGEGCCGPEAACGPLVQRTSSTTVGAGGDGGAAGDGSAATSDQTCCYYVQVTCGV